MVVKSLFGSRNRGNHLIKTLDELKAFFANKNSDNYIIEPFFNYNREYRLHVSKNGCFYTCRKMLKTDTPQDKRWFRNDSNSTWIVEENPMFDKPVNWDLIVETCVECLKAIELDFGAFDVRVQSAKNEEGKIRKEPKFVIIEVNSAPRFGEGTTLKYYEELKKLIIDKINE